MTPPRFVLSLPLSLPSPLSTAPLGDCTIAPTHRVATKHHVTPVNSASFFAARLSIHFRSLLANPRSRDYPGHRRGPLTGRHVHAGDTTPRRILVQSHSLVWYGLAYPEPAGLSQSRPLLRTATRQRHGRLCAIVHATRPPAEQETAQGLQTLPAHRRGCYRRVARHGSLHKS